MKRKFSYSKSQLKQSDILFNEKIDKENIEKLHNLTYILIFI